MSWQVVTRVSERKQSRFVCYRGNGVSWTKTELLHMQELLNHNAKVYLAARSAAKANAAIAELKNVTGKEAIFLQLDLADISAIRKSAEDFLSCVSSALCILCMK